MELLKACSVTEKGKEIGRKGNQPFILRWMYLCPSHPLHFKIIATGSGTVRKEVNSPAALIKFSFPSSGDKISSNCDDSDYFKSSGMLTSEEERVPFYSVSHHRLWLYLTLPWINPKAVYASAVCLCLADTWARHDTHRSIRPHVCTTDAQLKCMICSTKLCNWLACWYLLTSRA